MSNPTLAFFKRKYEKRFKYLPSTASTTYVTDRGDRRKIKVPEADRILQNARKKLKTINNSTASLTTKEKRESYGRLKKYTGGETPSDRKQNVRGLNKKQKKLKRAIVLSSSQSSDLTTNRPKLKDPEYKKIISTKNKTTVDSILSQTTGSIPPRKKRVTPQLLLPPKVASTTSKGAIVTISKPTIRKGISKIWKRGILGATLGGAVVAGGYALKKFRKTRKDKGIPRGKYKK